MYRNIVRDNVTLVAISIFVVIFYVIQAMKPSFLYNTNGSVREFGVGYRNKTILPIWLLSIILGVLCYLCVMYYVVNPKFF